MFRLEVVPDLGVPGRDGSQNVLLCIVKLKIDFLRINSSLSAIRSHKTNLLISTINFVLRKDLSQVWKIIF